MACAHVVIETNKNLSPEIVDVQVIQISPSHEKVSVSGLQGDTYYPYRKVSVSEDCNILRQRHHAYLLSSNWNWLPQL